MVKAGLKLQLSFKSQSFFPTVAISTLVVVYIAWSAFSIFALALGLISLGLVFLFSLKGTKLLQQFRALRLPLGALACGLLLGAFAQLRIEGERQVPFSGLPLPQVGSFKAVLVKDSVRSKDNLQVYSCRLFQVSQQSGGHTATASGSLTVWVPDGPALFTGAIIEAKGRLKEEAKNSPSRFVAYLKLNQLSYGNYIDEVLKARAMILSSLSAQFQKLGQPQAGLLEALFLGIKDHLDFNLRTSFTRTGSLHLLALSGLHVGILCALILFLLKPLKHRLIKIGLVNLGLLFYLYLVGPEPALLRACLMFLLTSLALALDRELKPLNILALTTVIVILFDPASCHSLSFKFSYLALTGILTLGAKLNQALTPYLPRSLRGLMAASIAAQVFTSPLVVAEFGTIYPVGLVASLLLIPLTTIFIWSGLLLFVISLIPFTVLLNLAKSILNVEYQLLAGISDFLAQAPGFTLEWRPWYWPLALLLLTLCALGLPLQKGYELQLQD